MFRAAAEALNDIAEKVHEWADWADGDQPAEPEPQFTGLDIVGIDFSTSRVFPGRSSVGGISFANRFMRCGQISQSGRLASTLPLFR